MLSMWPFIPYWWWEANQEAQQQWMNLLLLGIPLPGSHPHTQSQQASSACTSQSAAAAQDQAAEAARTQRPVSRQS